MIRKSPVKDWSPLNGARNAGRLVLERLVLAGRLQGKATALFRKCKPAAVGAAAGNHIQAG